MAKQLPCWKIPLFLAIICLAWMGVDTGIGSHIAAALTLLSPFLFVGYLVYKRI